MRWPRWGPVTREDERAGSTSRSRGLMPCRRVSRRTPRPVKLCGDDLPRYLARCTNRQPLWRVERLAKSIGRLSSSLWGKSLAEYIAETFSYSVRSCCDQDKGLISRLHCSLEMSYQK